VYRAVGGAAVVAASAGERRASGRGGGRAHGARAIAGGAVGYLGPFRASVDPPQLRPDRFAGRSGAPTTRFTPHTPGGAGAWGIAHGAGWLYIPDTSVQAPPCWIDDERRYRCTLLGPVTTPDATPVGLLTIDAPEPNALDGIDIALVRLLASLLATALSM
jgi:hypothetical protein